ncbi:hypothetical protein ACQY0O_005110 [Thecaphora frezii]
MSISDLYNIKATSRKARLASLLSLPTPTASTGITSSLCNLCYTNRASYTCPNCNVPYCSLACFRSQVHRECSTRFAVGTLHSELDDKDRNTHDQDRKKVMDILRRLQDPTLPEDDDQDDNEEADGEASAWDAPVDMDLDQIDVLSTDQLLALLTPSERRNFELALSDPQRAQQLVSKLERKAAAAATTTSMDLLEPAPPSPSSQDLKVMTPSSFIRQRSTEPQSHRQRPAPYQSIWQETPWWRTPVLAPPLPPERPGDDPFASFAGALRKILTAPAPAASSATRPNLANNLLAVLLGYTFVLRHLNISSLSSLLPGADVGPSYGAPPRPPTEVSTAKRASQSASRPAPRRETGGPGIDAANDADDDAEMPPLEPETPPASPLQAAHAEIADQPTSDQHRIPAAASSSAVTAADADAVDAAAAAEAAWQHRALAVSAFDLLEQTVPFLTALPPTSAQNKPVYTSTEPGLQRIVLSSAHEAALFVLARLRPDQRGDNAAKLLLLLFHDVQTLTQTERIVADSDSTPRYCVASRIEPDSARFCALQHSLMLNALWDLSYFLEGLTNLPMPLAGSNQTWAQSRYSKKAMGAQRKLAYYASKTILGDQMPVEATDIGFAQSVESEVQRLETEIKQQEEVARFTATARVLGGERSAAEILPPT